MDRNSKLRNIIKTNLLSVVSGPEDFDDMDVKNLFEFIARVYNICNSSRSMSNQSEEYIKCEPEYRKISTYVAKRWQILSKNGHLLIKNDQCLLKTIHSTYFNGYYHSTKGPNLNNEIQLEQLKLILPEYQPRLVNLKKTDLIVWNLVGKTVPFYYIGTYAPVRNIAIKFLKNILK